MVGGSCGDESPAPFNPDNVSWDGIQTRALTVITEALRRAFSVSMLRTPDWEEEETKRASGVRIRVYVVERDEPSSVQIPIIDALDNPDAGCAGTGYARCRKGSDDPDGVMSGLRTKLRPLAAPAANTVKA